MARLDPDTRDAIERALRDSSDTRSRAQLGRDFGVHPTTVRNVALAAGIERRFETAQTKAATSAARDHMKHRRAALAKRALDEAEWFLNQLHRPYLAFSFGGKDNTYTEHELPGPPTDAIRNLMTSFGIATDKSLALDKHDDDNGADDGVSMLGRLAAELDAAARELGARPAPAIDGDELDPGEPGAGDD